MLLSRSLTKPEDVGQRVPVLASFTQELFDLLTRPDQDAAMEDEFAKTVPRGSMPSGTAEAHAVPLAKPTAMPAWRGHDPVYPFADSTSQRAPDGLATPAPAPPSASPTFTPPGPVESDDPPTECDDPLDVDEPLEGGFAEAHSATDQPATIVIDQVNGDTGTTYRWPALPGPVTIYRVVVSDEQRPPVPEMGEVVATTTATSALDDAPVDGLFRFVQVWANTGGSIAAAKANQPLLHAECVRVGEVHEASGAADFGQVSLKWSAPEGATRVRVYRLPTDRRRPQGNVGNAPLEICADQDNLTGCVDRGGAAGASYTYRMVVEARDLSGGAHTSGPVDVDLEWPAVIREIPDLEIHVIQSPTKFEAGLVDLVWTDPPVGTTRIFRVSKPMEAGIIGVEVDKGALPQMGFTDAEECRNPVDLPAADGRVRMQGVAWPPNWARIYFVPVSILGQRALPGKPDTTESIPPPGDPRIVDRVSEKVCTFIWPSGATYVRVHFGPMGADPTELCRGPWHEQITQEDYRRHGGLRLQSVPKTDRDQAIYLTAARGETTSAAATVVLLRRLLIRYATEVRRKMRIGPVDHARFAVWAPDDHVTGPPPFVVVFRDDRLPMHARDGTILAMVPDETPDAAPVQAFRPATLSGGPNSPRWRAKVPAGSSRGYVRLFISPSVGVENQRRVVVLDPPISQLRWGG